MWVIVNKPVKLLMCLVKAKRYSQAVVTHEHVKQLQIPQYIHLRGLFEAPKNSEKVHQFLKGVTVINDFITESEENSLLDEVEPFLKKKRYEFDHWDDAIHGYRETERMQWTPLNDKIFDRVRNVAFPPEVAQIKAVHVLDLDRKGWIKPHIDAVRFCGDTIAGLSLLTDSVMRFVHEKEKDFFADVLLKRRSLYILRHDPRYFYTHEILKNEISEFRGQKVDKDRRISVICRNEPNPEHRG